jgi:hypothetical protein
MNTGPVSQSQGQHLLSERNEMNRTVFVPARPRSIPGRVYATHFIVSFLRFLAQSRR